MKKRRRKKLGQFQRRARQHCSESLSIEVRASNYLHHLDSYHRENPDMVAVVSCRVSGRTQGKRGNLMTQDALLRRKLKARGIPVIGFSYEVGSGWVLNEKREGLIEAVQKAKKFKNAVVVAISADRYLRHRHYKNTDPDILPSQEEYEQLMELVDGVPLLTYLDPDMPPAEVRGFQSKWGQQKKGNRGGRPRKKTPGYKKRQRRRKLDAVLSLHQQQVSKSEIARKTNVKPSTIRDWIRKYGGM